LIRIDIIKMLAKAGSGHPGGSLSAVEMLVALYFHHLRHDPQKPDWPGRDRFVLSKGHAVPVQYATLARAGYFDSELLDTLRTLGSPLQGHPDRMRCPGIEASTGALGQGLSIAVGMAMAEKLDQSDARVYCMIGDGESQEGQIWESALNAPNFKLDNLCAILDWNLGQLDGLVAEIQPIEPVAEKWAAFNWHVLEIDGNDIEQCLAALDEAKRTKGKPTMIVSRTIKGKGVSFMENDIPAWHGVTPNQEQAEAALKELQA
jgi:transketolase